LRSAVHHYDQCLSKQLEPAALSVLH